MEVSHVQREMKRKNKGMLLWVQYKQGRAGQGSVMVMDRQRS